MTAGLLASGDAHSACGGVADLKIEGRGIPWCGIRIFPTHRRLLRRNVKAFARRLRAQRDAYHAGTMTLEEIERSLRAWIAHASHGNTYRLRGALFSQVIF